MPKVTRASDHLSKEELEEKIKKSNKHWLLKRWLIIYQALIDPKPAKEIAKTLGVGKQTVNNLISAYNRYGVEAVETKGKGGRRREYLTLEEEKKFLERFIEKAKSGRLVTVKEIQKEFEEIVGHEVNESTIYYLLKRNNWKKKVPRSYHPKANKQEQETFKKNLSS